MLLIKGSIMDNFNWTCPYCHVKTTIIGDTNFSSSVHYYKSSSKDGFIGLYTRIIVCPNPECKEYVISADLYKANIDQIGRNIINEKQKLAQWELKPKSAALPLPDYIPEQIRTDYYEACAILSSSPKASATLSRRCLQGIVRDFWGIVKNRLKDEIDELESRIDNQTWNAIDSD
jgi:hypothetical protein